MGTSQKSLSRLQTSSGVVSRSHHGNLCGVTGGHQTRRWETGKGAAVVARGGRPGWVVSEDGSHRDVCQKQARYFRGGVNKTSQVIRRAMGQGPLRWIQGPLRMRVGSYKVKILPREKHGERKRQEHSSLQGQCLVCDLGASASAPAGHAVSSQNQHILHLGPGLRAM